MILAAHILGGSGACSLENTVKEWCDLVTFNVYFDQILS